MTYSLENEGLIDSGNTFLDNSKAIFVSAFYRSGTVSRIKKCIPGKMKCGLMFQHLPESIYMVRRYEIIGEECKIDITKLIRVAKWG